MSSTTVEKVTPRRAHAADTCTDLRTARARFAKNAGQSTELMALRANPANVVYTGPPLGKPVLVALDDEIAALHGEAQRWDCAVLRLERAQMSDLERTTFDAQAAAEAAVEEAEQALREAERERVATEDGDRPEVVTAEAIVSAGAAVVHARACLRVATAARDRARGAAWRAREAAIEARRKAALAEALDALDELERAGIPAARAAERFAEARNGLDTREARYLPFGPYFGPLRTANLERYIAQTRNTLGGRHVDDDGSATA